MTADAPRVLIADEDEASAQSWPTLSRPTAKRRVPPRGRVTAHTLTRPVDAVIVDVNAQSLGVIESVRAQASQVFDPQLPQMWFRSLCCSCPRVGMPAPG
jgi:hypothetical protein